MQRTLGLNAYEVRKNVGVFYNMTTAMGLTQKQAYDMSTSLTQLAYDMSSFYNLPYEDAFIKLQAGITGEIEPLRRLGIIVNDSVIKQHAYNTGLAKQGAVLTEQQKVLDQLEQIQKEKEELELSKKREKELFQEKLDEKLKEERRLIEEKVKNKLSEEQAEQFQKLQEELNEKTKKISELNVAKAEIEKLNLS